MTSEIAAIVEAEGRRRAEAGQNLRAVHLGMIGAYCQEIKRHWIERNHSAPGRYFRMSIKGDTYSWTAKVDPCAKAATLSSCQAFAAAVEGLGEIKTTARGTRLSCDLGYLRDAAKRIVKEQEQSQISGDPE